MSSINFNSMGVQLLDSLTLKIPLIFCCIPKILHTHTNARKKYIEIHICKQTNLIRTLYKMNFYGHNLYKPYILLKAKSNSVCDKTGHFSIKSFTLRLVLVCKGG